jgi:hypothetical protein
VVINSCNVTIPEDTSWETIPEEAGKNGQSWYHGPNRAIEWDSSKALLNSSIDQRKGSSTGRVAQFPRTADVQIEMSVLEKDLPYVGKSIWGDAPVQMFNPQDIGETGQRVEYYGDKSQDDASVNNFSQNIRYDINRVDQTNVTATP